MKKYISLAAVAAAAVAFGVSGAYAAGTATGTLDVSALMGSTCSMGTIVPVAFGGVPTTIPVTAPIAAGSITFTCSTNLPYSAALDDGANGIRILSAGSADTVAYELYTDNLRQNRWGHTGTELKTGTGVSGAITLPVYAKITEAAGHTVTAGTYIDQVAITISY